MLDRTGLRRSTLYRKIENGSFPRQVKLSTRCAGWRERDVEQWLRNPMFYSVDDHAEVADVTLTESTSGTLQRC